MACRSCKNKTQVDVVTLENGSKVKVARRKSLLLPVQTNTSEKTEDK